MAESDVDSARADLRATQEILNQIPPGAENAAMPTSDVTGSEDDSSLARLLEEPLAEQEQSAVETTTGKGAESHEFDFMSPEEWEAWGRDFHMDSGRPESGIPPEMGEIDMAAIQPWGMESRTPKEREADLGVMLDDEPESPTWTPDSERRRHRVETPTIEGTPIPEGIDLPEDEDRIPLPESEGDLTPILGEEAGGNAPLEEATPAKKKRTNWGKHLGGLASDLAAGGQATTSQGGIGGLLELPGAMLKQGVKDTTRIAQTAMDIFGGGGGMEGLGQLPEMMGMEDFDLGNLFGAGGKESQGGTAAEGETEQGGDLSRAMERLADVMERLIKQIQEKDRPAGIQPDGTFVPSLSGSSGSAGASGVSSPFGGQTSSGAAAAGGDMELMMTVLRMLLMAMAAA